MEWTEMLVVSLRGVNFGLWSRLGCSVVYIYPFRGLHKLRPRPDWSLFKISDECPSPSVSTQASLVRKLL